jgi:hypothetical protein
MRCTPRLLLCLQLLLFPALRWPHAAVQSAETAVNPAVQVTMKNVTYHYTDAIAVHISRVEGRFLPAKPGSMVVFDDNNSFTLALDSAEIAIGCNALARVLNENVFSSADAPVRNLTIESKANVLVIKGRFHQKGNVQFEASGTLSANGDGRIRLHAEHVKAAHLPVKGLMDLLGIDLAGLINTNKIRGVVVEKDDLILDPEQILPPPHIQGKVTAVRVEGEDIVQVFGSLPVSSTPFAAKQRGNYMAFRHGDLRFGKLTMHDADLIMIDMDPRDPFDFFLDHYQEQLVAGYTKSTPAYGLRVYMRDYNKLRARPTRQTDTK